MPVRTQAWVVSLTPFDARGALDEPAFRRHLQRMALAGIGVYVGSSNAGEGFALSPDERERVFIIAEQELRGRVPVRAGGCEPQSLASALEQVLAAQRAGLDAAHLFPLDTGHAGAPRPGEIEHYYRSVIEAVNIDVVISNYPAMGYTLPLPLVRRLLEVCPQLIAVRDAGADPSYLRDLVALCRGRAEVDTGGVRNLLTAMHHGSQGFLSSEANLAPSLGVAVVSAFDAGDFSRLHEMHGHLFRLHEFVNRFGGSAGRGIKPLLNHLGLPGGTLRAPRQALEGSELAEMIAAYTALDLPGAPTNRASAG